MTDIFNSEHNSVGGADSSQQQQQQTSESTFSQSTMADMRDTQAKYQRTQQSMALDLAKNSGDDPQQMLNLLMEMKRNQNNMDSFAAKIESDVSDFTHSDTENMRDRRKRGETDAQIAKSFDTNTSFINRRINGK
ncbi:4-diphosphocytidyl-2-C-methyl-D-erythritol kinase-4-(cytidine-5'-diphospho)-2-C-methyl-D-erythritol kinase [Moritella viscosa]|uniref:hypothetical protein n=1 Tax=Moritella viscosa TaxID=80854 RepID=UPI00050911A7|nr:hypothetical protein [Moritella viscosa]CED61891.1 putative DNA-binding protein [Moritella viscosa]SHO07432.1 4-diphosphocytidyl-2-C-methyl-D-erythritol kinase-4-(cytidine-5'-diphospho)-2-C-methyl-D-erythritol kinase [Moritella viscosa]SHO21900.1 4-diphosphocytidyl-2-C-methyl-D-erythritol kinase-4-(cytidine-5'-diphospho)-2-C-methyl-D-erythritol kinase [Moritella viscosa]